MQLIRFLTYESPVPAYSGIQKRAVGLLSELAREYPVELCLLPRKPLSDSQVHELARYTSKIIQIPRRDISLRDQLSVVFTAIVNRIPYHAAMVKYSFEANASNHLFQPNINHWVYATALYWTILLKQGAEKQWILDQPDADVQFWEVFARQHSNPLVRFVAIANRNLTYSYSGKIYPQLARIISVCEEDRYLTRQISPTARVEVIENGVDCDYFYPTRDISSGSKLLFTGTSAERNMKALRYFVKAVYPVVRRAIPEVQLIVGGNFRPMAQAEFKDEPGIRFTGKVSDLRPTYDQCQVFINPFDEAHGSKLKISEALAMGICIVSLPGGIRGMPVTDNESVLIGQDKVHMAQQVIRALEDPVLANRIGQNGRKVAERYLDWRRTLGPRLRQIVAEAMAQGRETQASIQF